MAQQRDELPNIEARLLAWAEILERAVADVQSTVSEIRSQAYTDPDPENDSQEE